MSGGGEFPILVHVRLGNENRARCGVGKFAKTASCTASPYRAARKAAAKYLGVDPSRVVLKGGEYAGAGEPVIFRVGALRAESPR